MSGFQKTFLGACLISSLVKEFPFKLLGGLAVGTLKEKKLGPTGQCSKTCTFFCQKTTVQSTKNKFWQRICKFICKKIGRAAERGKSYMFNTKYLFFYLYENVILLSLEIISTFVNCI